MSQKDFIVGATVGFFGACTVAALVAIVLGTLCADLAKRVNRLEHQRTYQGRDANGEEVWSAAVLDVPLPAGPEKP